MEHIGVAVLATAVAVDLAVGDAPNPLHPVYWLGKLISLETRLAPRRGQVAQVVYGTAMVIATTGIVTAGVYFLLDYIRDADARAINTGLYIVVAGMLLKLSFSIRGLNRLARRVRASLEDGDRDEARGWVSHLVSRDTSRLDEPHLVSATVESVSESACDSFVAPLMYFAIFGVPGAVAYRVVNTFDSMMGYHGRFEYLGKFAARLDDLANLVPARLTALLIVVAAFICRRNPRRAWRTMTRDSGKTESPNAGWPMSAAAGALGVQLEKEGCYSLGDPVERLTASTIVLALGLANTAIVFWAVVCLGVEVV